VGVEQVEEAALAGHQAAEHDGIRSEERAGAAYQKRATVKQSPHLVVALVVAKRRLPELA